MIRVTGNQLQYVNTSQLLKLTETSREANRQEQEQEQEQDVTAADSPFFHCGQRALLLSV